MTPSQKRESQKGSEQCFRGLGAIQTLRKPIPQTRMCPSSPSCRVSHARVVASGGFEEDGSSMRSKELCEFESSQEYDAAVSK